MSSSTSSTSITLPMFLLLLLPVLLLAGDGFDSMCATEIPRSTFNSIYSAPGGCRSFYAYVYNGNNIGTGATCAQIQAGLIQNGVNSLGNSREEGNTAIGRKNDAIMIPKVIAQVTMTDKACIGCCFTPNTLKNNIYAQCRVFIDAINARARQIPGNTEGKLIGTVWIRIDDGLGSNWDPLNTATNENFLTKIIGYLKGMCPRVGIMTDKPIWDKYFSSTYKPTKVPLFWANLGNRDYNGFVPFGPWVWPPTPTTPLEAQPQQREFQTGVTCAGATGVSGNMVWWP